MTLLEVRTPGETRFFERRPSEVFVTFTSKFAYVLWISFEGAKYIFLNFKLYPQKIKKKKQREKEFIARSDRAECVGIINFSLAIKRKI